MIFDLPSRQLYYDPSNQADRPFIEADEDSEGGLVSRITLKRNGSLRLEVQLQNGGSHDIQTSEFTCKQKEEYATPPALWASTASGSTLHILELAASTRELDDLLGIGTANQVKKATLMGEYVVVIGGKRYASVNPISVVVLNDISRPDEGEPNPGSACPPLSEIVTKSDVEQVVQTALENMDVTPTPDATTQTAGKVKLAAAINATDTGAASGKQVFDHVKNNVPTIQDATTAAKGIASFPASGGLKVANGAASVNVGEGLEIKDGKVCAIPVDLPPGVGEVITDTEGNIILETPYVDGTPKSTPGIKFVNKSTKPAGYENILRTDGDGRPEITGFGSIAFRNDIPDTSTFATKSELSGYATKSSAVFSGTRPKFNTVDLALLSEIPNISVKAPVDNPNFSGTIKLNSNPLVNIRYLYFTGTTWIESNTLMGSLDINSRYVVTLPYPARTVSVCAEIKARTSDVATGGGKWFRTGWATWVDSGGVSEACGVNADLYNGTAVVQTGLTRLTTTNSNYSGDPGNHTVKIDPANSCCRLVVIEIAEPTNRIS